jgi:hypothetical protein
MHSARHNSNPTLIETAGEFFSGGTSLELFSDPETGHLRLLFTNGRTCNVAPRIEYGGRVYVPLKLEAEILRAVRFPHQISNHISTKELFNAVRQVFMEYGFSEEVSQFGAYFVFSTWFPDCLPAAPCLLITGPRPEAELFLQLLACLVRHPLKLADFNSNSLSSLMKIQPTLLVCQEFLSPSKLRLLFASNNRNTYVPFGGRPCVLLFSESRLHGNSLL